MDKYEEAEQKGRLIFQEYCEKQLIGCKIIKFSTKKYSKWDVSYELNGINIIGEIKVRNFDSDTFTTFYLEEDKQEALNQIRINYKNNKIKNHYINIFNDNIVRVFDITDKETLGDPSRRLMQANTTANNQLTKWKSVYMLTVHNEIKESTLIRIKKMLN